MKILSRDGARVLLELRADGSLVDSRGKPVGHVGDGKVLVDGFMHPAWAVGVDSTATTDLFRGHARFDDSDALVLTSKSGRARFIVTDDGALVFEDPSGRRDMAPLRVSGVTGGSRRAAVLVALLVIALQREGPPPLPRRVTFTVGIFQLPNAYVELVSELRLARRWSLALRVGGGARPIDVKGGGSTAAWETGIEPRWFVLGNFGTGLYLGWTTRFARAVDGPVGFESLGTPPGISTGALIGFKSVDVPIITPDLSVGLVAPLFTQSTEASHPPAALVVRFGIGFSL